MSNSTTPSDNIVHLATAETARPSTGDHLTRITSGGLGAIIGMGPVVLPLELPQGYEGVMVLPGNAKRRSRNGR